MTMFFYEGQICPVCGKPFSETDDIVSCPVCGAPHHRACWQQEGHCHFEETHGTPQQWSRDAASPSTSSKTDLNRCPFCGNENFEYAEFCGRCGKQLPSKDWRSAERPPQYGNGRPYHEYTPFRSAFDPMGGISHDTVFEEEVTAEDLAVCVGGNTAYYIPRFKRLHDGRTFQWNWSAFLLTPYWLLYRKQYLSGILVSLFHLAYFVLTDMIFHISGAPSTAAYDEAFLLVEKAGLLPALAVLSLGVIVTNFLFGLLANRLYYRACMHKVQKAKQNDPANYLMELQHEGGISFIWGAVSYFGISFLASLIQTILAFM